MSELCRARCVVSGRVQGVFFRAHTRAQAEGQGLAGWVRNLPDGRVEAVFEGPRRDVQSLIDWCHLGSPASRVDHVEVAWEEPTGAKPPFTVRG